MDTLGECKCLKSDVKLYIEGAIIHFIRELGKEAKLFQERAVERKGTPMEEHYTGVASGMERYIGNLEKVKAEIKEIPDCKE